MDSGQILWIAFKLFFVALLIAANGFFVGSEFALVTVRRPRIDALAEKGNRAAQCVQRLQADPTTFISATQLGITIASLALGWIGEATLADEVFIPLFDRIWPERAVVSAHALAIPIAFISITYMHILFGELVPKATTVRPTTRGEMPTEVARRDAPRTRASAPRMRTTRPTRKRTKVTVSMEHAPGVEESEALWPSLTRDECAARTV